MRRVLVPLDGTDFAAAILPDACRLAGSDGELILIRDVTNADSGEREMLRSPQGSTDVARIYLDTVAQVLRAEGARIKTQLLVTSDAAVAIDEAAEFLHADMIAASTHGRSAAERLGAASIAWRALVRSTVPVLLRHIDPANLLVRSPEPKERRLMVPLDGSNLAESALPLAQALADQWQASCWLVYVVSELSAGTGDGPDSMDAETARAYLERVARTLTPPANCRVLSGPIDEGLVRAAGDVGATDIVLTSHGRTATSRALVGTVADGLIHSLRCPVIVIPIMAAMPREFAADAHSLS